MTDSEIINNVVQESRKVGKDCILVLTHKFDPNLLKSYQNNSKVKISQLKTFTGSIVSDESFYIYEILLSYNSPLLIDNASKERNNYLLLQ